MTIRPFAILTPLALLIMLGIVPACKGGSDLVGTYAAGPDTGGVTMTLEENGHGVWKTGLDEIIFKWSLSDETLVLHTRDGGILTGRPVEGGWIVAIPGAGEYHLRRTRP